MRHAHLVGSLPGQTADAAVTTTFDILGEHLRTLTDGETGERHNWGQWIVDSLRSHPDLVEVRGGGWTGYDDTSRMRVRRGRRLTGAALDLGYLRAVIDGHPLIEQLRSDRQRTDLQYQVGMASPLT